MPKKTVRKRRPGPRLVRRRLRLAEPLWLWVGGKLTHPKGDPKCFGCGPGQQLLKVLRPGATLWHIYREAR